MSQSEHRRVRLLTVCETCGVVDERQPTLEALHNVMDPKHTGTYGHARRNDHIVGEVRVDKVADETRKHLDDGDHTVLDYPDDLHWRPDEVEI